jgi:hypothetical protein
MAAVAPADGLVPLVFVPAVVAHPDIHVVSTVCGFANVMDCTSIINNEGFQSIAEGFGILEDKDMIEMVKCLGGHSYNCRRTREDLSNSGEEIASSLLLGT